ncbi:MAG: Fe-S protein assembly chaperone HscA [Nitrospirae bacterium]|nr:Fe-S protein assembly chaperone HscA [Nitrospirota bacterium]MCL5285810.1 Fe-S protein assembly chaperone HscA [Nitrospirota bacterium]
MNRLVVGIDLGTTHSLVAYRREDGHVEVIPDREGRLLLPSVVALSRDGVRVGWKARERINDPETTVIYAAKRLMGRSFEETESERPHLTYPIVDWNGSPAVPDPDRKRFLTPPEIGALVLRDLRSRAEEALAREVTEAVITVPAYFNDAQRQATKDAGSLAGLNVLRIINEPTAAALAYGLGSGKDGLFSVFDLGGGTFDFSLLDIRKGIFEVRATSGDTHLGGEDFDRAIVSEWLGESPKLATLAERSEVRDLLRKEAERAKIALSSRTEVEVAIPAAGFRTTLTRDRMNALVEPFVEKALSCVRAALSDSGTSPSDVDGVILVGGSTRFLRFKEAVASFFGKPLFDSVDPDLVVAEGAAVQADILSGRRKDLLLLDVTPLSLGIETIGGVTSTLIPRNTTIPAQAKELFTTYVDGQTNVDIHVLQGEREMAKDNRSLARFTLSGVPPLPAGTPRIEVTFQIDANGILEVTAREQTTGTMSNVVIHPSYGLGKDDVRNLLKEAFSHAQEDFAARLLVDARTEAQTVINATVRALERVGSDLLPEADRRAIFRQVEILKKAMEGSDGRTVRDETRLLDNLTQPLAERLMNQSITNALSGMALPKEGESHA